MTARKGQGSSAVIPVLSHPPEVVPLSVEVRRWRSPA